MTAFVGICASTLRVILKSKKILTRIYSCGRVVIMPKMNGTSEKRYLDTPVRGTLIRQPNPSELDQKWLCLNILYGCLPLMLTLS